MRVISQSPDPLASMHTKTDRKVKSGTICESAWNKDPVFGVIGIQSGPPGRWVHSGVRGGCGGRVGDAGIGDDREDPSGVFRPEQADQDDLPRVSGVAKGRAQGHPVAGDRVSLRASRQPLPRIDPWRDQLDGLLLENKGKPARERLTLIRIFEELRALGYEGSYDAV